MSSPNQGTNANREEDEDLPLPKYSISTQPADYPLDVLYRKYKNQEIVIPKFQRKFVWTIPQASRLVESFIKGLPVPPLYLFDGGDGRLQVVDGVQRLLTISSFMSGRINNAEFRLQGMHERSGLYKKAFSDLPQNLQLQFKNAVLRCMIIRQWDPEDGGTSMYQVFSRLNTGGTALSPQEIRNCIYAGPLTDTIEQLNDTSEWRAIYGTPRPDKRKKDEQLILRYMALFHDAQSYKKPMVKFLNEFMQKNKNADTAFLNKEKERFRTTCAAIMESLGNDSLRYRRAFHSALFDSVFVAFAKNLPVQSRGMKGRMEKLKQNPQFQKSIEARTSDEESVKQRLALAESVLFG